MKQLALTVVVVLMATVGARVASGWTEDANRADQLTAVFEEHAAELGVEEATRTKVRAIVAESRPVGDALRKDVERARGELRDLLSAVEPNENAILEKAERIGALETQALKHRLRTLLRLRPLLTTEQIQKLGELRAQHFDSVQKACWAGIASLCPQVEPGFRTVACLHEHEQQLSDECRAALSRGTFAK